MAKIKYTKNELKIQKDALRRFTVSPYPYIKKTTASA